MQGARRRIWVQVRERRWEHWGQLNGWLLERCRSHSQESFHLEWPELTVAEVLQDEVPKLMATLKPFDGYIELLLRVSPNRAHPHSPEPLQRADGGWCGVGCLCHRGIAITR